MNKKNISIVVGVIVIAIVIVLLILFGNKNFTVEFDSKGGSSVKSQEVKRSGTVTKPENPTRDGYIFDNWYYEDKIYDFETPVKKDFTLEARWLGAEDKDKDGKFTVTFNTGGGSKISSVKVDENGLITKPEDPTRDGYKFVEWQYNGKTFDFKTMKATTNMTLTAIWEKDGSAQEPDDGKVKLTINSGNFTLTDGGSKKLTATVKNTKNTVTWSSSNTKVATVDKNGTVKAVGVGTAKITAIVDGVTKTLTVTVKAKQDNTGNQGGNQGGNDTPVVNPDPGNKDPEPVDPTPEVTYRAVCEDVAGSSLQECEIKIIGSDGKYVSGKVRVENQTGGSGVVSTGYKLPRSSFKSATFVSVD